MIIDPIRIRRLEEAPARPHCKDLNKDHYFIGDQQKNGAGEFEGELILVGSEEVWGLEREYLRVTL